MSIVEIENKIIEEAQAQAQKIKADCDQQIAQLENEHAQKKAKLKTKLLEKTKRLEEDAIRAQLVPARLKARREKLLEKQKFLTGIYNQIKQKENLSEAETTRLRESTEVAAAQVLFGA